jgi:tetratricopeptide (TPR) repeat protein
LTSFLKNKEEKMFTKRLHFVTILSAAVFCLYALPYAHACSWRDGYLSGTKDGEKTIHVGNIKSWSKHKPDQETQDKEKTKPTADAMKKAWDEVKTAQAAYTEAIKTVHQEIKTAVTTYKDTIKTLAADDKTGRQTAREAFRNSIKTSFEKLRTAGTTYHNAVKAAFDKLRPNPTDTTPTNPPAQDDDNTTPTDPGIDFSTYTDSQSLTAKAWEYINAKNYTNAKAFAQETITRYTDTALAQQASLKGFAAKGKESDYWALNDVATAYFIMGKAYAGAGKKTEAKAAFNQIINNYKYAQCYDAAQKLYWKVAQAAQEELDKLD